jgi:hypothetical protein
MQPDGSDPLVPLPIIGDLDGDTNPSCTPACVPDYGNFPDPFPDCQPGSPVIVPANADCSGVPDQNPGNGRCDLAPGDYGDVVVQQFGKLTLVGGTYNVCSFSTARNTSTIVDGPSIINIASPGTLQISNESSFGQQCGDIAIRLEGNGEVTFGRNASITANVCAPRSTVNLGHNNVLTGQFIGDVVESNSDNDGFCCEGGVCACFDEFKPTSAHVGDEITLTSACDLTSVTAVKICDITATINTQSSGELKVTVPVGAAGACTIKVESAAGVYTAAGTLNVS